MGFIDAVGLLGPTGMEDIRLAAQAFFGPPPERRAEFDALFRVHFFGEILAAPAAGEEGDEVEAFDADRGGAEVLESDDVHPAGGGAAGEEALSVRRFEERAASEVLRRFRRQAPKRLPRRRSSRFAPARQGTWDMRRSLREWARTGGEALALPRRHRKPRLRRILFLIDISGSMKESTQGALRFAHALTGVADRVETFTLGTRLTRISAALRLRNPRHALDAASSMVADWDGGTRIGDALQAFLAVPRFAGFARGAAVVVLSDGLERDDPAGLVDAVRRLARLAWRIDWLTPLAGEAGFAPRTQALAAILPDIDALGDGSSPEAVCGHVLGIAGQP